MKAAASESLYIYLLFTTNAPQLKIFNFQIIIGNGNAPLFVHASLYKIANSKSKFRSYENRQFLKYYQDL